jgi:hypothetical protein
MKKFKVGNKVRVVEDHRYLGVTKKATGVVTESGKLEVAVKFRRVRNVIVFHPEELVSVE